MVKFMTVVSLMNITVLSRVHHENLVFLLGYYNESEDLMIIYEHMSKGSLRDLLYGIYYGRYVCLSG